MKIVFNLQKVGLGNNGGTKTLIRCAETLQELGQEVYISSTTNSYNYHKIKVPVIKILPICDVLIASGFHSVKSTLQATAKAKFYYVRGFETWQAPEKELLNSYKSLNCIVNSEWLQKHLKSNGIESHLIYPGLDFDQFYRTSDQRESVLGGLHSSRHKTKRYEDVVEIGNRLSLQTLLLNRDNDKVDYESLRNFYNKIKVWISPSELEGLHNCPMEAALCGCAIVCSDHEKNGMQDYVNENTADTYPARNLNVAILLINRLLYDDEYRKQQNINMVELLHNKIGTRQENMRKMVNLFESVLNAK